MQDLKGYFAKKLYGISVSEAHKNGVCIQCKEKALLKCYSLAGKAEYKISGLCEECFDEICDSFWED